MENEAKAVVCPLCYSDEVEEKVYNGTRLYVCIPCPFIGLEFLFNSDAENLLAYVKSH